MPRPDPSAPAPPAPECRFCVHFAPTVPGTVPQPPGTGYCVRNAPTSTNSSRPFPVMPENAHCGQFEGDTQYLIGARCETCYWARDRDGKKYCEADLPVVWTKGTEPEMIRLQTKPEWTCGRWRHIDV